MVPHPLKLCGEAQQKTGRLIVRRHLSTDPLHTETAAPERRAMCVSEMACQASQTDDTVCGTVDLWLSAARSLTDHLHVLREGIIGRDHGDEWSGERSAMAVEGLNER